ncbi:hypothetical protein E2C00_00650 [Streptomyces sp. WAC05374]|uniref:hypothetical protein n=1 Tax=Streptomyces sp. WAC05374 TaxID=2487420 RepID=UPI000F86F250|nr:hypothetical protein [Streptomyces sp. WAC05374]RST19587.1 hypothetical protein EF905_00295 [Streptomyces sp. WAC05374]TDF50076.1 hypothetical protein E2B92_00625 [Streptomyces sp. WAC05374]TDF57802.1 hypothetical protein E2C02_08415 [Streptomyces sp. WAC05374]TDF60330.1 hypothetical protein E2C00_00650 [Streptomyces sp. WAC05374]
MSSTIHDVDHALAHPEPPASPLWRRHGEKARPLTPAQQRRNRELLDIAQQRSAPPDPAPPATPRSWRRPSDGHQASRRRRLRRRPPHLRPTRHRRLRADRPTADADTAAPDTPDTVVVCSVGDPRITELLLTGIGLGDLLRVIGTLVQPDDPAVPGRLTVDAPEVLAAAPIPVPRELVFDRYGQYAVIFNADRDAVPVFLASGEWVGGATSADLVGPLIDAFENGGAR